MASDRWRTILAFLLLIAVHAPAYAQPSSSERAPASVGFSLQYMRPRGEFRENTRGAPWNHQGGFGFDLLLHVNSAVAVRLDYFGGGYDKNLCYSCDHHSFRAGGIGGELGLPAGPMRPYVTAGLGRISISSFDEADGSEADTGAGYRMYGAGVRMPIRSSGWSVDLAWRHHEAGPVSYRRARLNLAGSLDVDFVRTRIPFDMLTIGFQYRFAG